MSTWQYFEDRRQMIEFRKRPGQLEFRPIYRDQPRSYADIHANAELRAQGGAWCAVPPHLVNDVPEFE